MTPQTHPIVVQVKFRDYLISYSLDRTAELTTATHFRLLVATGDDTILLEHLHGDLFARHPTLSLSS